MATGKKTLIHPITGKEHAFDAEHADRILKHNLNNKKGLQWKEKPSVKKKKDAGDSND